MRRFARIRRGGCVLGSLLVGCRALYGMGREGWGGALSCFLVCVCVLTRLDYGIRECPFGIWNLIKDRESDGPWTLGCVLICVEGEDAVDCCDEVKWIEDIVVVEMDFLVGSCGIFLSFGVTVD